MEQRRDESSIPLRADYGRGVFTRRIHLRAEGGAVHGELEDDFHHFAVTIRHDGERVIDVRGRDVRVPWTTCPESVALVERLRGLAVTRSLLAASHFTEPSHQCTHLFDIASLAVCHAARRLEGGAVERRYHITLPDRVDGRTRAELHRDGEPLLRWLVQGVRVVEAEPEVFGDRSLASAMFNRWAERDLEPDWAEAALVLRRAVFIGLGRQYDFDRIRKATTFARVVGSACHTFSPQVVGRATRVAGSTRELAAGSQPSPEHRRP